MHFQLQVVHNSERVLRRTGTVAPHPESRTFQRGRCGRGIQGSFKIKSYSRVPITTSELGVHIQPHTPLSFKIIEKKAPYCAAKL